MHPKTCSCNLHHQVVGKASASIWQHWKPCWCRMPSLSKKSYLAYPQELMANRKRSDLSNRIQLMPPPIQPAKQSLIYKSQKLTLGRTACLHTCFTQPSKAHMFAHVFEPMATCVRIMLTKPMDGIFAMLTVNRKHYATDESKRLTPTPYNVYNFWGLLECSNSCIINLGRSQLGADSYNKTIAKTPLSSVAAERACGIKDSHWS